MHDNSHLSPQVRNMKTSTLAQACSIALVCVQAIDMLLLLWLLYRLSWGFGRLGCGRLHELMYELSLHGICLWAYVITIEICAEKNLVPSPFL